MAIVGKNGKVTLGASTIVGMGTWSMDGITVEEFDQSDFGDEWKTYLFGMKDGGNISFNGHYEPTDTTGQQELMKSQVAGTNLTSIRLYIDNTSYFEPCQTAGYFAPGSLSTGQNTIASSVRITSVNVGLDKSGLGTISFTGKVSGCMVKI